MPVVYAVVVIVVVEDDIPILLYPVDTVLPPVPNLTKYCPLVDDVDIPFTMTVIRLAQLGIVVLNTILLDDPVLTAVPKFIVLLELVNVPETVTLPVIARLPELSTVSTNALPYGIVYSFTPMFLLKYCHRWHQPGKLAHNYPLV